MADRDASQTNDAGQRSDIAGPPPGAAFQPLRRAPALKRRERTS